MEDDDKRPGIPLDDPRVFWAAERTLLAWTRTAVTMMGFGFVVARFGFYLQRTETASGQVQHQGMESPSLSLYIGVALVALGALTSVVSAVEHMALSGAITPALRHSRRRTAFATATSIAIAAIGALLTYHLIKTSN
jgi:putative membrane protein